MQHLSLFLFAWLASQASVSAVDVYYSLNVEPILDNAISLDCANIVSLKRPVFAVNGQSPGPPIEAMEGDTIHVNVTNNQESQSLTIHWHGIHQRGTPYMDGSAQITQCALGPFQSQVYSFTAYPPGTHFYHAHQSMLMADGITGMIVVTPTNQTREYDEERMVDLTDWYHVTSDQQVVGLLSDPFVWVGNPDSILINGKAIWFECQQGGQFFNNSLFCLDTCSNLSSLLETIEVEEGKKYRFRIVNSASLVAMNFAIKDHNLTIVEADGTYPTKPIEVSSLDITPGQRYSVLLNADHRPNSYWMQVTVRYRNMPDVVGLGILHYAGSSENETVPPLDELPQNIAWNDTEYGQKTDQMLLTVDPSSYPESFALNATVDKRLILVSTQANPFNTSAIVWAINNISSTMLSMPEPLIVTSVVTANDLGWPSPIDGTVDVPDAPPFTWNYSDYVLGQNGPGASLGSQETLVLRLTKGEVVEFVMQNTRALNNVSEVHPWHMHGHRFWVVGQGSGSFDPNKDFANFNLKDPMLRDTTDMYPLGWTAIRFYADNPGVWLFHCHIASHMVLGMGLVIITQPDEVSLPPPGAMACTDNSLQETDSTESATPGLSSSSAKGHLHNMIGAAVATVSFLFATLLNVAF